jgi:hypothetical protein
MFKALILTRRRPDLDPQAFKDRYVNHHAAIVARMPGLISPESEVNLPICIP